MKRWTFIPHVTVAPGWWRPLAALLIAVDDAAGRSPSSSLMAPVRPLPIVLRTAERPLE